MKPEHLEPPATEDSSTRSWDRAAADWVKHADTNDYRNLFIMPLTFEMLGDVRGLRVLDLGCGEGGYSRELRRRGAAVTGLDGSPHLVAIAKERAKAESLDIPFLCANASGMETVAAESFDLVLASMSLMDVEDYPGAVFQIRRVLTSAKAVAGGTKRMRNSADLPSAASPSCANSLKSGGELVMSITHPCFSAPVSKWIRDEAGDFRHFAVDRYFERSAWEEKMTPQFHTPILRRHRPLEDYMRPLLEAGFVLRELREPAANPEDVSKSVRFERMKRVPYFLFMRWQKP